VRAMTPARLDALARARAARHGYAAERGSYFTSESALETMRHNGKVYGAKVLAEHSSRATAGMLRSRFRVPKTGNPLVIRLFELIRDCGGLPSMVHQRSGVPASTLARWRRQSDPSLFRVQAVLQAMGYDLAVVRKRG
jgi:DNA-binding phage protein